MFEALVITLREGVEAVLVLAIALATLRRRGQSHLSGALYAGTAAALVLSMGVAALATRVSWNEELTEGIAMLIGATLVITLVVWMWRAAPRMKEEIESGVTRATGSAGSGVAGIFLFAFAMVFREGAETAIFLSAARFNSEGLALWLGAVAGLALAFGFGVLFVRGSVRVPLRAFFTLTSAVLSILALQLIAGGLHELSEALVLPASKTEMAIIGPIVRSELLLFTLTIALIAGWLLVGPGRPVAAAASAAATGPEARLARAEASHDAARRRWIGIIGVLMVGLLSTAFVRQSRQPLRAPGEALALAAGEARFDPAALADGHLRFYEVPVDGHTIRFFALKVGEEIRTCFDACEICGDKGYYERGTELICRNCVAPIVRTSLGRSGGCNPIPLTNRRGGDGTLSVSEADLRSVIPHLKGR